MIRSLLLEWDAIGAGVPDDEYGCMIWPLYKLIRQRSSNDEIAAWVRDYRRDHFGLEGDGAADTKLAERLSRRSPISRHLLDQRQKRAFPVRRARHLYALAAGLDRHADTEDCPARGRWD